MRPAAGVLLACLAALPGRVHAGATAEARAGPTNAPQLELCLAVGAGATDWHFVFFGASPRPELRVAVSAVVPLTDRLSLRLPLPAVELRGALADDVRFLAHAGVLALSVYDTLFLFQTPQDTVAVTPPARRTPVTPRVTLGGGLALRLTRVSHDWTFAFEASTTRALAHGPAALALFTGDVSAGLALRLGPRLTVHLALGLANSAASVGGVFTTPPVLTVGSVQHAGVRRPPLLRLRLTDTLSLDLLAGAWIGVSGRAEALLGVTWRPEATPR